jgi:hypothetical protein
MFLSEFEWVVETLGNSVIACVMKRLWTNESVGSLRGLRDVDVPEDRIERVKWDDRDRLL